MKRDYDLKKWMKSLKDIKKICLKELKQAEFYLFGSFVEGKYLPTSDIDILIVSKNMPKKISERSKIKAMIWKKIGIFTPFELHLVNYDEFEWYKRFVKKLKAF
ncbi:MAG: nucleotidyltransferase domain-containing protein [Candidatus Aenigmatarchaeota archaeon]